MGAIFLVRVLWPISLTLALGPQAFAQIGVQIVIDNLKTSNILVGSWTSSTYVPGFVGSNYVHDGNSGKGLKSFEFVVPIATGGSYELRLSATVGSTRAAKIPISVQDQLGLHKITISENSAVQKQAFISLGLYQFATGTQAKVTISNAGTSGFVTVDALELVQTSIVNPATGSFTIQAGREFAANSYVFAPLSNTAPLDPNSATYVKSLQSQIATYYGHVDMGASSTIYVVDDKQPTSKVVASYSPLQALFENVPVPVGLKVDTSSDHEQVIYDPSNGQVWEFWEFVKSGLNTTDSSGAVVPQWGARWGGRMDNVSTNPGYWVTSPTGNKFGATASGIPLLAGTLTIDELSRGEIDHIIGVAVVLTKAGTYRFPAQRTDGFSNAATAIPEGTIFRFPANLNLDAMITDKFALMVAKAIQKHGMIVWDGSGAVTFRAEIAKPGTNPYYSDGGIYGCQGMKTTDPNYSPNNNWNCWPPAHFKHIPWELLQVILPP